MLLKLAKPHQSPHTWFTLICLIWLPINLYSLTTYATPMFADDAWVGSIAAYYLETGEFKVPIFGNIEGFSTTLNFQNTARLYIMGLSLVFRIGGVGLAQARIFSVIGAAVGGYLTFLAGRKLGGNLVGLLAASLYLFALRVLWISHNARPDMWVNAASMGCLLGFWHIRDSRKMLGAVVLGLLSALIVEIVIVAVYASIATGLSVLIEFRQRKDWKLLSAYTLGGLIGTFYWLLTRYPYSTVEEASTFLSILGMGTSGTTNIFSLLVGLFPIFLSHTYHLITVGLLGHSRLGVVEVISVAVGMVALGFRRQANDKNLLLWTVVLWLGLLYPPKGPHHLVDLACLFSLIVAGGMAQIANRLSLRLSILNNKAQLLTVALCAPLLLGQIIGNIVLGRNSQVINYDRYAKQLQVLVPKQASILGEGSWWWEFRDQPYTHDYYLVLIDWLKPGQSAKGILERVIAERQVNVILLDEKVSFFYLETHEFYDAIHSALVDYTQSRCHLAGIVADYSYGIEQGGPAIKRTSVFICP